MIWMLEIVRSAENYLILRGNRYAGMCKRVGIEVF